MQLVGNYLEGFLSRPGILEHSTKGMISKREESSLVRITLAYKMKTHTSFFKPVCMFTGRGTGMLIWNGKSFYLILIFHSTVILDLNVIKTPSFTVMRVVFIYINPAYN